MKNSILLSVVIIFSTMLKAQSIVKPIRVGDKCPDLIFSKISNSKIGSVKLSDFRGKLVILDFGGFYGCHPCITGAIELDSLMRHEFKDKMVTIYCVSKHAWGDDGPTLPERKIYIDQYLKSNKSGKLLHQIVDWGDTLLSNYFPHKSYPHMVWIGKDGRVLAITTQDYLKPQYIQQALSENTLNWETKYDKSMGLDLNQPFVIYNQMNTPYLNGDTSIRFYSTVLNYLPGLERYDPYYSNEDTSLILRDKIRVSMINMPIAEIYLKMLRPTWESDVSRIIYEVSDISRYNIYTKGRNYHKLNTTKSPEWRAKNLYSYDAIFPLNLSKEQITSRVLDQINYSLGLNGRIEKRNVKAWVLISSLQYSKQFADRPVSEDSLYRSDNRGGYISIKNLLYELTNRDKMFPVIDESHLTNENLEQKYVRITLHSMESRELLNEELQPYGLSITEGKRDLEMLVITENGYKK